MGQVIVTFKVMPADSESNLDSIESSIKKKLNPQRMNREPLAFGLQCLMVTKLIDEVDGEMERNEAAIRSIDGVGEVEITEVNRSM